MADIDANTVDGLARQLNLSTEALLILMREAGLKHRFEDAHVSTYARQILTSYLEELILELSSGEGHKQEEPRTSRGVPPSNELMGLT